MCPFSILTKTPSTCTVLSASLLFLTFSCLFLCFPTTIFYYFCSFHFKTFPKLFCNLLQLRTNFPFWLSFSSLLSVETFFFFFFFLTYLRISCGFSSLLVSQWETSVIRDFAWTESSGSDDGVACSGVSVPWALFWIIENFRWPIFNI